MKTVQPPPAEDQEDKSRYMIMEYSLKKMKNNRLVALVTIVLICGSSKAFSAPIDLYDWAFNVDGDVSYFGDPMPTTGSLDSSGLGTLSITFDNAGSHSFISFFDYEIDEPINSNYNEYGSTSGVTEIGQSWEIDEPGWVFGDIFTNVEAGALDNTNSLSSGLEEDVSFAMGWDFSLAEGETAVIDLFLSDVLNTSGFYLAHMDDHSSDAIYFWSSLTIKPPVSVPEPGSLILLSFGLVGLVRCRKNAGMVSTT